MCSWFMIIKTFGERFLGGRQNNLKLICDQVYDYKLQVLLGSHIIVNLVYLINTY